ncbi:PH, RCC1 and FYVE domains-containing protein 1-like [Rutidosis leptorrhynchoides]|uniref:PH, RCC1 and FYVE domains-containing protein 1-like n=1 Tax=Rutidosis leptorrhynchoides TaxID=125765 RepID=UPI003A993D53
MDWVGSFHGPYHTAIVTSSGQLFTFDDGTFGVLGHGDRKSNSKPREVESLNGLRTVKTACGVWHTAAIVEIMINNSSFSNCSSGKLFTWGDGDKCRLGHGDKETKLVLTFVSSFVDPNFCQVACGHSMTVALTTSGHVYTMGGQVYGQLVNPQADGKLPTRVEGKLSKSFVEEIACGAYHVAVLTSRTEVYLTSMWFSGLGLGVAGVPDVHFSVQLLSSVDCGVRYVPGFMLCLDLGLMVDDQSEPLQFQSLSSVCTIGSL